jgi:hypothetical protein
MPCRNLGPAAGLDVLDSLSTGERIAGFHHVVSVRAHLLEMAGDRDAARSGYRKAARRTTSEPERRHLHPRRTAGLIGRRVCSRRSPGAGLRAKKSAGWATECCPGFRDGRHA